MKKIVLLTLIFTTFTVIACKDFLDVENPNQLTTDSFFKTDKQAISAVNAIYAGLQANNLYNREYFFTHDLLSDDNMSGGAQLEAPRNQLLTHVFDGSNSLILAVWRGLYRVILRANFAIQNLPEAEGISDELRSRLLGEAHFLRAWAYFELVSLWGDVPMYTEPNISPDGKLRSSEEEIYTLIFADLTIAENNLPLNSTYAGSDIGRASKGAAQALEGKIRMFRGEYAAAKTALEKVVNSNEYSLVARYSDNLEEGNEFNSESIFEVLFTEARGSAGAWSGDGSGAADVTFRGQEYGANTWRNVIPSTSLIAEFEDGDPRYDYNFWLLGETYNNGQDVLTADKVQGNNPDVSWQKYSNLYQRDAENFQSGINFRVIRLADVFLMLAEAENEVNGPTAIALDYLNRTRNRADVNMPNYPTAAYPTATKDQMFAAIVHERRVELCGEQIRNRDIRRWRRQGKLTTEPIANYQSKHDKLPIPIEELDNNNALTSSDQNPGY
ncbi:MAG: RagB/SusD family nutrient uptake outer membrane protein [Microscillaceae bacterium]|nr:RagB/SusD family nutrient uptake outer membrane protein [Microscillaceae bacterium]